LDLFDNLLVIFLHPINFSFELFSLCNLPFHQDSVLLHYLVHILIMLIYDIIDGFFELSSIFFFLSLQFLELCSILKHLLRILIPLLFKLDLELLCQLFDFFLKCILHFSFILI